MEFDELMNKFLLLKEENQLLRKTIERLKSLHDIDFQESNTDFLYVGQQAIANTKESEIPKNEEKELVNKHSSSTEKIELFMSLFKGREDVYAKRWENKKQQTSGYSPACANEWAQGICLKPKIKCSACNQKNYMKLDKQIIENHLRGNIVAGVYPLLTDETCWFLSIDFDDEGWKKDIYVLRKVCSYFDIPVVVERSRSGNGAHAWFFFDQPVQATLARKFGSAMLTYAMNQRHEIAFKSYDRLFPNQDTMPKGGFGNLIALPLQKAARENNNSVFIDDDFKPYKDQWAYLSSIRRLTKDNIESLFAKLCKGNELGTLKEDTEEMPKPWETSKVVLQNKDFPDSIEIVKANMLFIPKADISQKALNRIKRLAAFKNPEFYKAQAMRLSTFKKPRIISCSDETEEYLCLPRGCENELKDLLKEINVKSDWVLKTNSGRQIEVTFKGTLRDDQPTAVSEMLAHNTGVLCGTTAFGKTVAAIKIIAERKINTLILVNKVSLVNQWKEKLNEFLTINEAVESEKQSNKNPKNIIGQIGDGKQIRTGIIDIAIMQSLTRMGEVKEFVKDYGMVIVDECHHVPAFSFEMILKNVNAEFVYGLSATPERKDGHHPIIFMHCGPVRFRDDAKKQAEKRPFEHYIIPRFTSFRIHSLNEKTEKDWTINELYAAVVTNETRNQQIIDDVIECHKNGRNCLVLTERVEHVKILSTEIGKTIPDVISVTGGMGTKETRKTLEKITTAPADKPIVLVASGRFIGEGFDEPRLDTLFLAMPISWKGTLQQYAGRLHRLFAGKNEALIYDYVDIHVQVFEKMYNRRLSGYASIGYKAKGENFANLKKTNDNGNVDIIFDKSNFLPVFLNDILNARNEILIVSPFVTKRRTQQMVQELDFAIAIKVNITVVTRPASDFTNKDLSSWNDAIEQLKTANIHLVFKSNIHQKFAIFDQKIVWYGSINLFSYGAAEESMMRIESTKIAYELIGSLEKI
ncbi:MAG: type III restriction protein res [Prolixibacteraceae bacterium]|nr:MAG: type III restriction protein res [Prolixibacteraceae bacterium]